MIAHGCIWSSWRKVIFSPISHSINEFYLQLVILVIKTNLLLMIKLVFKCRNPLPGKLVDARKTKFYADTSVYFPNAAEQRVLKWIAICFLKNPKIIPKTSAKNPLACIWIDSWLTQIILLCLGKINCVVIGSTKAHVFTAGMIIIYSQTLKNDWWFFCFWDEICFEFHDLVMSEVSNIQSQVVIHWEMGIGKSKRV